MEESSGGNWFDRTWRNRDAESHRIPTFVRCAALQEQPDGTANCGLHDKKRPEPCSLFPVWYEDIETMVLEGKATHTRARGLPRCTWFDVLIVPGDWPVLERRNPDGTLPWDSFDEETQQLVIATVANAIL